MLETTRRQQGTARGSKVLVTHKLALYMRRGGGKEEEEEKEEDEEKEEEEEEEG